MEYMKNNLLKHIRHDIIEICIKETGEKATGRIFCLMGKSSSGKDTILQKLLADEALELSCVVTYTTRPKRDKEIEGREYHFITERELKSFERNGKVIEKRCYNTVKGTWFYATIDDGAIDISRNDYILVSTLAAFRHLKEYFGNDKVVPLYIEIDDDIRLERALNRERNMAEPNYEEMCRRYLADSVDFSKEKLCENGIANSNVYNNNDLERCVESIKKDIKAKI